jgi:hypothetical protein
MEVKNHLLAFTEKLNREIAAVHSSRCGIPEGVEEVSFPRTWETVDGVEKIANPDTGLRGRPIHIHLCNLPAGLPAAYSPVLVHPRFCPHSKRRAKASAACLYQSYQSIDQRLGIFLGADTKNIITADVAVHGYNTPAGLAPAHRDLPYLEIADVPINDRRNKVVLLGCVD